MNPGEDREVEELHVKLRGRGTEIFKKVLVRSDLTYLTVTYKTNAGRLVERHFSHQDIFEYFVFLEPRT